MAMVVVGTYKYKSTKELEFHMDTLENLGQSQGGGQMQVNLSMFGKRSTIDVPSGSTYRDVLAHIPNSSNLDVRVDGSSISDRLDTPAREGQYFTAVPRSVKQGS